MIDNDRLIKAWEIFRDSIIRMKSMMVGSFEQYVNSEPEYCFGQIIEDTIAELKEQENMIPITTVAEYLAGYAAPPVRSSLAVYGDLVTAWERFLKDLNRR